MRSTFTGLPARMRVASSSSCLRPILPTRVRFSLGRLTFCLLLIGCFRSPSRMLLRPPFVGRDAASDASHRMPLAPSVRRAAASSRTRRGSRSSRRLLAPSVRRAAASSPIHRRMFVGRVGAWLTAAGAARPVRGEARLRGARSYSFSNRTIGLIRRLAMCGTGNFGGLKLRRRWAMPKGGRRFLWLYSFVDPAAGLGERCGGNPTNIEASGAVKGRFGLRNTLHCPRRPCGRGAGGASKASEGLPWASLRAGERLGGISETCFAFTSPFLV